MGFANRPRQAGRGQIETILTDGAPTELRLPTDFDKPRAVPMLPNHALSAHNRRDVVRRHDLRLFFFFFFGFLPQIVSLSASPNVKLGWKNHVVAIASIREDVDHCGSAGLL